METSRKCKKSRLEPHYGLPKLQDYLELKYREKIRNFNLFKTRKKKYCDTHFLFECVWGRPKFNAKWTTENVDCVSWSIIQWRINKMNNKSITIQYQSKP